MRTFQPPWAMLFKGFNMSQAIGFLAEETAKNYLISQGLQWVLSNYRCKLGEIDLIMRDSDYLVFIEVRARASDEFGGALESVTYGKQRKLIKAATLYLLANKLLDKQLIRFDVLCIEGVPPKISWIRNAFGLDY